MKYQDCAEPAQAADEAADGGRRRCGANINADTGLATDYLNHFNEAIMLLEMVSACPDCIEDFLAWRPMTYREHFAASRFKDRDLAIAAYNAAEPGLREYLDAMADTMTVVLETTRTAIRADASSEAARLVAAHAVACLKPMVARAGGVINGGFDPESGEPPAAQAAVDALMKQISS
jgi:hypothetical protein